MIIIKISSIEQSKASFTQSTGKISDYGREWNVTLKKIYVTRKNEKESIEGEFRIWKSEKFQYIKPRIEKVRSSLRAECERETSRRKCLRLRRLLWLDLNFIWDAKAKKYIIMNNFMPCWWINFTQYFFIMT